MAAPRLSIIIPAYNESSRLPQTLDRLREYIQQQEYETEIFVVDDCSTDGTPDLVRQYADRLPVTLLVNEHNRGKGYSTRRGMLAATGQWRLFSDADLSTPIEEIEKFWPHCEQGRHVIIGSRALAESDIQLRQTWLREFMGRTFNKILQLVGIRGIKDTQCGFKMFSAEATQKIFPHMQINGFAFDVEALLRARKLGYHIAQVPVRWINSPDSKVSIIRDSFKMLYDIIRIRFKI